MQKKAQKKKVLSAPLIALAIGGVILLAAAIYLVVGSGGNGGTPDIVVDQEVIDYGTVKFETPLSFKFVVTNNGDGTLRFNEKPYLEIVEGC